MDDEVETDRCWKLRKYALKVLLNHVIERDVVSTLVACVSVVRQMELVKLGTLKSPKGIALGVRLLNRYNIETGEMLRINCGFFRKHE